MRKTVCELLDIPAKTLGTAYNVSFFGNSWGTLDAAALLGVSLGNDTYLATNMKLALKIGIIYIKANTYFIKILFEVEEAHFRGSALRCFNFTTNTLHIKIPLA